MSAGIQLLAILCVAFGLATVLTRNILRSTVYLMGCLSLTAGLYLAIGAEFLAGIQILVYVGGIVVMLVFAVMLTRSSELVTDHASPARKLIGALVASGFFLTGAWFLRSSPLESGGSAALGAASTREIGRRLLDTGGGGYALPFELISVLLLAVLIGGVVLARRDSDGEEAR